MKTNLLLCVVLLCSCAGRYESIESRPEMKITLLDTLCTVGDAVSGTLDITRRGYAGAHALAVTCPEGQVALQLDRIALPQDGEWTEILSGSHSLRVEPLAVGPIRLHVRLRSEDGATAQERELLLRGVAESAIRATVECEHRIVNPTAETLIPIRYALSKAGYAGLFTVRFSFEAGGGACYRNGLLVTDTGADLSNGDGISFQPVALGRHVLLSRIGVGEQTVTLRTTIELIKRISVEGVLSEFFSVSGVGDYMTEGQAVTLSLLNREGFNYEAERWTDTSGNLVAAGATCPLKLSLNTPTKITLKLKQRVVQISNGAVRSVVTGPLIRTYYMPLVSDYAPSEKLLFRGGSKNSVISFDAGALKSAEMSAPLKATFNPQIWTSENPALKFDTQGATSATTQTRYLFNSSIQIVQK